MFVIPVEKKTVKKPKSKISVAIDAKIRYLNEASAFAAVRLFMISVNEIIEKSSRQRKKKIKSEEPIKRIPEMKASVSIRINS